MHGGRRHPWAADQVQQREQENPHDVDEVPVEAGHFDGRVVVGPNGRRQAMSADHGHEPDADDHVQRVEAGHAK